jgi:ribosomal protein S18 acetylase RimI-like enzyme
VIFVRQAQSSDAPAISELLADLGYPSAPAQVQNRIAEASASPHTAIFVAESESQVVGALSFHCMPLFHTDGSLGRITSLIVSPTFQRRGVGRLLVAAAEEMAHAHDCARVEVTSGEHRPEAHAFYESLGYQPASRRFVKSTRSA